MWNTGLEEAQAGNETARRNTNNLKCADDVTLRAENKVKVIQLCLTLCDPMDYIVHGIPQTRILAWVAVPFSRRSSQCRDRTQILSHCRWILYHLSHQGSPRLLEWVAYPFSSGSSRLRNWTRVSALQEDSLPAELPEKPAAFYPSLLIDTLMLLSQLYRDKFLTMTGV